jgi:hypothetical protein
MKHLLAFTLYIALANGVLAAAPTVQIPMAGFLKHTVPTAEESAAMPLLFTFPADYVDQVVSIPGDKARVVGLPEDIKVVSEKLNSEGTEKGVFIFNVSPDMAFNGQTKKFSGEGAPDLENNLRKIGATNVDIKRITPKGIPVLLVTCELKGRHIFLVYIPFTVQGGPVMKIAYRHPVGYQQIDSDTWQQFIAGLSQ